DWEDVGREDALEVLDIAKKTTPHDPGRVFLTGHSMGGHGTWSIGTMYPDLFGVIAPSAGWISFWTYAGGWTPRNPTPEETIVRRSMNSGDTMDRIHNTFAEAVYVLHGSADDNVPVEQARRMRDLLQPWHPDFTYHEQPGAGHWWGNQCVDWPPIFDEFKTRRLDLEENKIDFTTANPAVSSHDRWAEILQQQIQLAPSHVVLERSVGPDGSTKVIGTTENVQTLRIRLPKNSGRLDLEVNGVRGSFDTESGGAITLRQYGDRWVPARLSSSEKTPERSGPFKQVYANHFEFVYQTTGTPEEQRWSMDKARYDQETFY